jgi:hypothetical protein
VCRRHDTVLHGEHTTVSRGADTCRAIQLKRTEKGYPSRKHICLIPVRAVVTVRTSTSGSWSLGTPLPGAELVAEVNTDDNEPGPGEPPRPANQAHR